MIITINRLGASLSITKSKQQHQQEDTNSNRSKQQQAAPTSSMNPSGPLGLLRVLAQRSGGRAEGAIAEITRSGALLQRELLGGDDLLIQVRACGWIVVAVVLEAGEGDRPSSLLEPVHSRV